MLNNLTAKNQNWRDAAIDDLENTSMSYDEIARKYGRSTMAVMKLRERANIIRAKPNMRRGPRKFEEARSLSSHHRAVGSRLTIARANTPVRDFADRLGVSVYVLRAMELGIHDYTLSELLRISDLVGRTMEDLINPISIGVLRPSAMVNGKDK